MKIVITAGGTSEKIDDVRTITNSSTGRLGYAVGTAFLQQYADELEAVYYLHGTRARHPEHEKVIPVEIGGVAICRENLAGSWRRRRSMQSYMLWLSAITQ